MTRAAAVAVSVGVLASVLTGCRPGGGDRADLRVRLSEWSLVVEPASVSSGTLTMAVDNTGAMEHELRLVAVPADGKVVLRQTGELDLTAMATVDSLKPFAPGRFRASFLRVLPGQYLLACNLVTEGQAHQARGMVQRITVRPASGTLTTPGRP